MSIRVLHIITKLELGGAQINTIYTFDNLNKSRFKPFLVSGKNGILNNEVKNKKSFFIINHLDREINPFKDFIALYNLYKFIKKAKPDIVHTHSSKAGILGRVAAKLNKVDTIIHSVHGFAFSPNHSRIKNHIYIGIEKLISRITDHFIFVAKSDMETAKKKGFVKDNYSLIRSGFTFERFLKKFNNEKIQKKYNIRKNAFICGIIAPFKPQKGLFHLIKIAEIVIRKNKNILFIIAGDGDLRDDIERELRSRNIKENFILPGFIKNIEELISIFDIGISTALWEGLPQSLVQMRIMKKTVITSDIPGNIEIIKDGKNGYTIPVKDYNKFANKILELAENKQLLKLTDNYEEDLSDWKAETMVKKQEDLYRKLFNKNNS